MNCDVDFYKHREAADCIIGEAADLVNRMSDVDEDIAYASGAVVRYEHMASPSVHTTRDLAETHNYSINDRGDKEYETLPDTHYLVICKPAPDMPE